ncbi:MBL fold metallo-hydrolase [Celerinatantimonas sp. YJH-8]|uniref:MBL fold metallo-hydrolase n=1 Tax=Celerinatantimonas sp. YJH-8 TaxID=3228714 RepID=UPI0038CBCABE
MYLFVFIAFILIVAVGGTRVYLNQPQFDSPKDPQRWLVQESAHSRYADGRFSNPNPAPVMTQKNGQFKAFYDFLFKKDPSAIPEGMLPSEKTDLLHLDPQQNVVVWMGHSSLFIQMDGHTFLIDPVFSHNASPVPHTNVAFSGSNIYTAADMPEIDYLLITHDHWDHLDYPTIHALQSKVKTIVVPLGIGSYFRQWGYDSTIIHEQDWYSQLNGANGLNIYLLPAQHFSGRMFNKNQTLWGSFALISAEHRIYISGDSGYGPHFKAIGQEFGPFDLAILENGQYNRSWAHIHMFPEQTAQAGVDLRAKYVMPEHNSKFKLSHHPWNEPMERLAQASEGKPYTLWTPMIGQTVDLGTVNPQLKAWWRLPLLPQK